MPEIGYITASSFPALMTGVVHKPEQLTVSELQEALDRHGISYNRKALKAELINALPQDYMPMQLGWTQTSAAVVKQLVLDQLGVQRIATTTSRECERGIALENEAMQKLGEQLGCKITPAWRGYADDIPCVSGELDGVYDLSTGVEVKCPSDQWKHLYNVTQGMGKHIAEYWWQLQGEMWIYDFSGVYFASYGGEEFPEQDQLVYELVSRSDKHVGLLKARLMQSVSIAEQIVLGIKTGQCDKFEIYFN